ncbi:hypothetical protein E2C01_023188 [Portunus trituberculatus]|uniref:Uncharacterized protein n=1 Tax=Portunus trituberculatus TaxID=210409 RepID=A0A5B7EAH3_PORTR|nr:hypothetical protein [Portunus trituberculatus]
MFHLPRAPVEAQLLCHEDPTPTSSRRCRVTCGGRGRRPPVQVGTLSKAKNVSSLCGDKRSPMLALSAQTSLAHCASVGLSILQERYQYLRLHQGHQQPAMTLIVTYGPPNPRS